VFISVGGRLKSNETILKNLCEDRTEQNALITTTTFSPRNRNNYCGEILAINIYRGEILAINIYRGEILAIYIYRGELLRFRGYAVSR
jgi:hypothetical protein